MDRIYDGDTGNVWLISSVPEPFIGCASKIQPC